MYCYTVVVLYVDSVPLINANNKILLKKQYLINYITHFNGLTALIITKIIIIASIIEICRMLIGCPRFVLFILILIKSQQ